MKCLLDMIHNKQYPYCPIPTGKTPEGGKLPSHEHIQRLATAQTAGWFYEQKVVSSGTISRFFLMFLFI